MSIEKILDKIFDGAMDGWITIHYGKEDENGKRGYKRLFIRDGETPKEAMKRSWGVDFDKKDKKGEAKKEEPKTEKSSEKGSLDTARNTYKDTLAKYKKAEHIMYNSSEVSREEWGQAIADKAKLKKQLTKDRRDYAESIMANFEKSDSGAYEDKLQARKEYYEGKSEKASQESNRLSQSAIERLDMIPAGQPIHGQRDRNFREKAWNTIGRSVKEGEKAEYYADRAKSVGTAGISSDDVNAIAKLADKYKGVKDSAERRRIIDRVISIHETGLKNQKAKAEQASGTAVNKYEDLGFNVERNSDINRLQLKFSGVPDAKTRDTLKHNGFRWSPKEGAWQRQLNANSDRALEYVAKKMREDK